MNIQEHFTQPNELLQCLILGVVVPAFFVVGLVSDSRGSPRRLARMVAFFPVIIALSVWAALTDGDLSRVVKIAGE